MPSVERLNAVLDYDPSTGILIWKVRPISDFQNRKYPADRLAKSWNSKNAGKPALSHLDPHGYLFGGIDGVKYKASRIIWKMMTGEEPDTIDHINGMITDNRLANLRNVTPIQNQRNLKLISSNKTGFMGVRQNPSRSWRAEIGFRGKMICLGAFQTKEEAIAARQAAERLYSFDPQHGRR